MQHHPAEASPHAARDESRLGPSPNAEFRAPPAPQLRRTASFSETSSAIWAGVWVMRSANVNANHTSWLNKSLCHNYLSAATLSSETPAALLPTALVSVQKGQPANR